MGVNQGCARGWWVVGGFGCLRWVGRKDGESTDGVWRLLSVRSLTRHSVCPQPDLYRFQQPCEPRSATFYLRQVISSVNFRTGSVGTFGGDLNDFTHGWLNYQAAL